MVSFYELHKYNYIHHVEFENLITEICLDLAGPRFQSNQDHKWRNETVTGLTCSVSWEGENDP